MLVTSVLLQVLYLPGVVGLHGKVLVSGGLQGWLL